MIDPLSSVNLSTLSPFEYQVITLKEFSEIDAIILDSVDHGDFVVLKLLVRHGGGLHLAVQGVLRGQVMVTPPLSPYAAP